MATPENAVSKIEFFELYYYTKVSADRYFTKTGEVFAGGYTNCYVYELKLMGEGFQKVTIQATEN
ncbi:MAG: hypothetical protein GX638_06780 [Crenarchaeota archaeon]|nr:hypothetical protein [Thermoproteota archaeon]